MSFTSATHWAINGSGATDQGGAFDTGVSGFPTDGAATSANTSAPVFSSASYTFVAGDVSAWIYIKSGTNWIPGWYQIASVSAGAATLSAAIGAAALDVVGTVSTVVGCATTASPTGATWGIDYSQSTTNYITFSDMVIDGTTNTKFTSAGNPVGKNFIGNSINVTSGTGFTVQRVVVVSTVTTTATCDKSLGTLSSTGGNGKLGGAVSTFATIAANTVKYTAGNTIHIKSGTYTQTTSLLVDTNASVSGNCHFIGFGSVRYDGGTRPLITTATNTTRLITLLGGPSFIWKNVNFSNTASTRADGFFFQISGNSGSAVLIDCTLDGFASGINGDNVAGYAAGCILSNVEIKNCTSDAVRTWFAFTAYGCYIHGNSGNGLYGVSSAAGTHIVDHCIIAGNTGSGVKVTSDTLILTNNTIANNTVDGVVGTGTLGIRATNNIVYGNVYGFNFTTTATSANGWLYRNNAVGSNSTANYASALPASIGDVALTANPFTNPGSGDYSLNSTAGGGAACKQAGLPAVFPGGTSTGALDIGAVQTSGASGGGGGSSNFGFVG